MHFSGGFKLILVLSLLTAAVVIQKVNCQSGIPAAAILPNVSYGSDPQQVMDVYLPAGRNLLLSKIIMVIHGGGWSGGKKEDMNGWVYWFYTTFPQHAIVNIGYRLGTVDNPGFPKQINDIKAAIGFMKSKSLEYFVSPQFALMGASAGGHLSMLYGYGYDKVKDVKVICNLVGPTSLVDPSYTNNRNYDFLFYPLVGNYTYVQNPQIYSNASPVSYINSQSTKTISFYGDQDPLIPNTQGAILEDKLDSVGVYNKYYLYPGGGHATFSADQNAHMFKKITYFFNNYFK